MSNVNNQQNESWLAAAIRLAKHAVLHNLGIKVLALAIALVMWTTLITQDPSLTREKSFDNVPVNVVGEDTLKRNGFILVSKPESLSRVSFNADVPQGNYNTADESNYNARIDLSRVSEAGLVTVRVSTSNSTAYGAVRDVTPSEVEVEIEEYVQRTRIPVIMQTTGSIPENFAVTSAVLSPSSVTVSGPKSVVQSVARVQAIMDLSVLPAQEGEMRTSVKFQLVCYDGSVVDQTLIDKGTVTVMADGTQTRNINVEHILASRRMMPLLNQNLVIGTPAEGYEVQDVFLSSDEIEVVGSEENLELIDYIMVDQMVDVTGASESITKTVRVTKPSGVTQIKPDTVTAVVVIGPIIEERTFDNVGIKVMNTPSDMRASLNTDRGSVTIRGPKNWLKTLQAKRISLVCDAAGYDEGLSIVQLSCRVEQDDGSMTDVEIRPETVQLVLKKR